jgi:hypothetical protein
VKPIPKEPSLARGPFLPMQPGTNEPVLVRDWFHHVQLTFGRLPA